MMTITDPLIDLDDFRRTHRAECAYYYCQNLALARRRGEHVSALDAVTEPLERKQIVLLALYFVLCLPLCQRIRKLLERDDFDADDHVTLASLVCQRDVVGAAVEQTAMMMWAYDADAESLSHLLRARAELARIDSLLGDRPDLLRVAQRSLTAHPDSPPWLDGARELDWLIEEVLG